MGHIVGKRPPMNTITTNGATFQMKSAPCLCTSQQNARQNTNTLMTMDPFAAIIGQINTATFALENATVVKS